jgi:hypothetical protein
MYRSLCSFSKKDMQILNLCKVQEFIDKGRLVPKSDSFITIRDFLSSGLISRAKDGVKLLAQVRLVCMVRISVDIGGVTVDPCFFCCRERVFSRLLFT